MKTASSIKKTSSHVKTGREGKPRLKYTLTGLKQPIHASAAPVAINAASGSLDKSPIWTPANVRAIKQTRFNPLRGFTPSRLVHYLDAFEVGYLDQAATLWEAMLRRDDVLSSVAYKRTAAVALRTWGIRSTEEATRDASLEAEAESQAERLRYFWNNIRVTSAYDRNVNGGFAKFVDYCMDVQSFRYGAFHLVWRPTPKGLTATLEHVPLRFFENLTGQLRYLGTAIGRTDGEALDGTNWLVMSGRGCMEPASVGYGFKHLALSDWLSYCERYGMPFPIGETQAAYDSPEWTAMEEAVDHIVNEGSAVIGPNAKISLLQAAGQGEVPMQAIVDRMDQAFAIIYRGNNLSTKSAANNQGASLQGNESLIIEAMDCGFVSEVMQDLERRVLAYYDGEGVNALAYGAIKGPNLRDTRTDLEIDDKLTAWGVRLSKRDALERYQREPANDDEESLGIASALEVVTDKPKTEDVVTAANAFNPAQIRDRSGRWTKGYGVPNAAELAKLRPEFEDFAAFNAEPEDGQEEARVTIQPAAFEEMVMMAADRQREQNLSDTFAVDNVDSWPLPRETRTLAQSLENALYEQHDMSLEGRSLLTGKPSTVAGEQMQAQLLDLRKTATTRRNEARKNAKLLTKEINRRLTALKTNLDADDVEQWLRDEGFLNAAVRISQPVDAFDGGTVANNAKPTPAREPTGTEALRSAVAADLKPVIDRLKAALKADDLSLLETLNEPGVIEAVLKGRSLEAALMGELGASFAQSVGLPELINEVLTEEQKKAGQD